MRRLRRDDVARLVRASEKITNSSPEVAITSLEQVRGRRAVMGGDADRCEREHAIRDDRHRARNRLSGSGM